MLGGRFSVGVILNIANVSINLYPYLQLDVSFVGVTLQWASGALSNSSIIATTNTFTSQLVTDRQVLAGVWTDCLQALTQSLSFCSGFCSGSFGIPGKLVRLELRRNRHRTPSPSMNLQGRAVTVAHCPLVARGHGAP